MSRLYFSLGKIIYIFLCLLLALLFEFYWIALIIFLGAFAAALIFRKYRIIKDDGNLKTHGQVTAPSFGIVKAIDEGINHKEFGNDLNRVIIQVPHFFEFGLYLPVASEFTEVKKIASRELFRYRRGYSLDQSKNVYSGTVVKLRDVNENEIGLQYIKCYLGLSPDLWVLAGDRGAKGSRIGVLPFGGTVILYLSKNFKIICQKGEKLIPGNTIVAKEEVNA